MVSADDVVKKRSTIFSSTVLISGMFWVSAMFLGWWIHTFLGAMYQPDFRSFTYLDLYLLIQIPLLGFLVTSSFFFFHAWMLPLRWVQRFLLVGLGSLAALAVLLISMGTLTDSHSSHLFFFAKWVPGPGWGDFITRTNWYLVFGFLFGSAISNFLLSEIFCHLRIRRRSSEEVVSTLQHTKITVALLILLFAFLIFFSFFDCSYFVSEIFYLSYIQGSFHKISSLGFVTGSLVFVSGLLGSNVRRILFCLIFAMLSASLFVAAINFDSMAVPVFYSFGFLTLFLTLGSLLTIAIIEFPESHPSGSELPEENQRVTLKSKNSKLEDPWTDSDPVTSRKPELEIPIVETVRTKSQEEKRRLRKLGQFDFQSVRNLSVVFSLILVTGFTVPWFVSPYFLLTTGDFQIATLVASSYRNNGGRHFLLTDDHWNIRDFSRKSVPLISLKRLVPLADLAKTKSLNHSKLRFRFNIAPILESDSRSIDWLSNLKRRLPDNCRFSYTCRKPNGGFFTKLYDLLDDIPSLDAADLTDGESKRLLESFPFTELKFVKNCRLQSGNEKFFNRDDVKLFGCQIDDSFDFSLLKQKSVWGTYSGPIISTSCEMSTEKWEDCFETLLDEHSILVFHEDSRKLPWPVLEMINTLYRGFGIKLKPLLSDSSSILGYRIENQTLKCYFPETVMMSKDVNDIKHFFETKIESYYGKSIEITDGKIVGLAIPNLVASLIGKRTDPSKWRWLDLRNDIDITFGRPERFSKSINELMVQLASVRSLGVRGTLGRNQFASRWTRSMEYLLKYIDEVETLIISGGMFPETWPEEINDPKVLLLDELIFTEKGLANLSGNSTVQKIVIGSNCHFRFSSTTRDGAELKMVKDKDLRELIEQLRLNFDVIILDEPLERSDFRLDWIEKSNHRKLRMAIPSARKKG